MTILLTFDIEDWFQVENLRLRYPPESWGSQSWRVEASTRVVLDALDEAGGAQRTPVRATFFVLGSVAEKFPALVREIRDRGHEVASHGYWHRLCCQERPSALRDDLLASKALLEDILGSAVHGYRAPSFSISDSVLHMIHEAGYEYDSSLNSFALNPRYGTVSFNGHRRGVAWEIFPGFYEIPVSNLRCFGQTLPWAGGGYFRLLPFSVFSLGVGKILHCDGAYVFYMHPWECDPDQPRVSGIGPMRRFRHYCNLSQTVGRLQRLIKTYGQCRFLSCSDYLAMSDHEIFKGLGQKKPEKAPCGLKTFG
uniref:DUF3473 domain-containing protein n=1 Tax=Desulfacinum infernum TaxID=35837 RepID=A0A832A8Q1_9BACT